MNILQGDWKNNLSVFKHYLKDFFVSEDSRYRYIELIYFHQLYIFIYVFTVKAILCLHWTFLYVINSIVNRIAIYIINFDYMFCFISVFHTAEAYIIYLIYYIFGFSSIVIVFISKDFTLPSFFLFGKPPMGIRLFVLFDSSPVVSVFYPI